MIVHTVIAVGERGVGRRLATTPLAGGVGRMGIFAAKTTAIVTDIEAVGAYTTLDDAQNAAAAHLRLHPSDRVKIKVVTVDALPAAAQPPRPQLCVECGVDITGSARNRCPPCLKAYYQACRDADPLGGAPDPAFARAEP